MITIDTDSSGNVSVEEFSTYVGYMGGTVKLFEARRKRMGEHSGTTSSGEETRLCLKDCGIDDEAQAHWRLVVPPTEFMECSKLVLCQKNAVGHIRRLAKDNHTKALPKLQQRVKKLGSTDNDLWMTLAWVRELAPIILHLNPVKMIEHLEKDTHYRNQFETASSGGLLNVEVRKRWERDLFGGKYEGAEGFNRCKYGVLNVMNDFRGVVKCSQYGDSYLVLKDVRLRCTFSPEDSANLKADRLAVLDYYAHVLNEYSDAELAETLKVANSKTAAILGDSSRVGNMKYKETQVHGEVRFDTHVERFVVDCKHKKGPLAERLPKVAAQHGWAFSWMDEEQARMRAEDMHKLGAEAWQQRLQTLEAAVGSQEQIDGICRVAGCRRLVCPGVTRSGNPFTTCCRGCVMGFGHDLRCGTIDGSKVGKGLCKNGCGRKVAKGLDAKGRQLDTCCRGCALELPHDATCERDMTAVEPGLCKLGCGRPVCPGKTASGRTFDTCCRLCVHGKGHDDDCNARA